MSLTTPERRRVIVTFKKKDTRANPEPDKLELLAEAVGAELPVAGASYGPLPRGLDLDRVVYDVDAYEAPIVIAALDDDQIDSVRSAEDVAAVEEDGPMFALGQLVIEGQPSVLEETVPAGVAAIKAPAAWDASRGKAIKVAVLDTGIAPAHPDLVTNLRTGMSFVSTETSTDDFNGHGTHVAGTIAAAHDQIGVVGVAPAAALYAVKVLDRNGRGQWSNLIAGIDWCINAQDIRILNMSLGGPGAPAALEQMCVLAWERGRLLVAAAGNDGGPVGYPAKWESVVAVSALDSAGMIASFSNRGPEVEVAAPGVNVLSTVPGGGYGTKSGTSMASPHVAGTAALVWGSHRFADNITVRRLLAWRADPMGRMGRTDEYGYGRVDAEAASVELEQPPPIAGIP
jgi:subtilisin